MSWLFALKLFLSHQEAKHVELNTNSLPRAHNQQTSLNTPSTCHQTDTMPLVKIDMIKGVRTPEEIKKLADVVQEIMLALFAAPPRDRYQVTRTAIVSGRAADAPEAV